MHWRAYKQAAGDMAIGGRPAIYMYNISLFLIRRKRQLRYILSAALYNGATVVAMVLHFAFPCLPAYHGSCGEARTGTISHGDGHCCGIIWSV